MELQKTSQRTEDTALPPSGIQRAFVRRAAGVRIIIGVVSAQVHHPTAQQARYLLGIKGREVYFDICSRLGLESLGHRSGSLRRGCLYAVGHFYLCQMPS